MSLAEAERSSQWDKTNAREGVLSLLPSKSPAGRKEVEAFSHKLSAHSGRKTKQNTQYFPYFVLPACGLPAQLVFGVLVFFFSFF